MDPAAWGSQLWSSLHYIALGYPSNPSTLDRANYKMFFEGLYKVLPCNKCATHYQTLMTSMPIDGFLDNSEKLFEWTYNVHNSVNNKLGKPEPSLQWARAQYNGLKPASVSVSQQKESESTLSTNKYVWIGCALLLGIIVGAAVSGSRPPLRKQGGISGGRR